MKEILGGERKKGEGQMRQLLGKEIQGTNTRMTGK